MIYCLNNFEETIDPVILKRGFQYYKKGLVTDLSETEENKWIALVEGTEVYQLEAILEQENIIEMTCDCPYDMGAICKHQAAFLYRLREELNGTENINQSYKRKKSSSKSKKQKLPNINEILNLLSIDDLKEIILSSIHSKADLESLLKVKYLQKNDSSNKEEYNKIIKKTINSYKDRSGFIDYWNSSKIIISLQSLYDEAQSQIENNPVISITICKSLIEQLVPLLGNSDDSNGDISGGIDIAFEMMTKSSLKLRTEELNDLFVYSINESS